MKKILFNIALFATGLLIINPAFSQDKGPESKYKKTRTYTKSYPLNSSDKVKLNNQFGEMKLVTWDKNEVKLEASMTGKSDVEERAQQILDHISIDDGKEGNTVSFKTKFTDDKKVWNKDNKEEHHNEGMEINYVVYLPAGNPLDASNQFGEMILPDYKGEAVIECKFGTLTAGKISNAREVSVEFGEANIAQVSGGKLSIKFSNATINKLTGDIKTNLEFSEVKLNIDNDIKNLDLRNSYSTVYLDLNKSLSASYNITTSHGDFSNKTSFAIREEGGDDNRYGPKFTRKYNGTSGSGSARLTVESSFGEIIAGHDLKVDFKKDKEKNKQKIKTVRV